MPAITPFGAFHTVLSLIAVAAGIAALVRDREISPRKRVGKIYILMTVLTCLTGFGIFHHGGFGKPHVLGVITLLVLAVAWQASRFGKAARYVETVSYSLTFFFHLIPGVTETATRLPVGAPLVASQEAPALQAAIGALFLLFLICVALQVRQLRAQNRKPNEKAWLPGSPAASN
jgi:uncharacterized membrane protein